MSGQNLWGDLPKVENLKTPYLILKEQAAMLSKISNNLIEGHTVVQDQNPDNFVAVLRIIAPPLENYSISIISIRHEIGMYPVQVSYLRIGEGHSAGNEQSYLKLLENIFQHVDTQIIIKQLLTQIKAIS